MNLPKKLNEMVVDELGVKLGGVKDCILIDHAGMGGQQTFDLRGRLRKGQCRMQVVKNAVARVTFEKAGLASLKDHLKGSSALLYGKAEGESILAMAKVVTEWNKDKAKKPIQVKAALMAGTAISAKDVERLAAIPPRQELLAKVAGGVQAPLTQLVGALAGVPRKLVYAVKAVADQKAAAPKSEGVAA